jgi:MSHA pilin protein MshC
MSATLITDGYRKNTHGFTFIEIIAVLVIIGIMSAVAVTIFSSLDKYKLISEVEILKTHLRYAQSRAMSDVALSWEIVISEDEDGYLYTLQRNGDLISYPDDDLISYPSLPNEDSATHRLQDGVTASSANITFDIWGSSGAKTITLSTDDDSRNITVTANTGFIP